MLHYAYDSYCTIIYNWCKIGHKTVLPIHKILAGVWPLTLTYEFDLDISQCTCFPKTNFLYQGFQKDRQTHVTGNITTLHSSIAIRAQLLLRWPTNVAQLGIVTRSLAATKSPCDSCVVSFGQDNNNNNNNNPIYKATECQKTSVALKRLPWGWKSIILHVTL